LWELGDEGGAEDIQLAYSIDPNDLPTALAFVDLLEWEEPEHAFEILDRLTEENPDDPGPFLRRAKMHSNRGDYEASAVDFAAAIERGLDDSWIRTERAMVLIAAGNLAEAIRETDMAAQRDPESPEVSLVRARLAAMSGDSDVAGELYAAYLESEWVHQPVRLESAMLATANGDFPLAGWLIRSFEEIEGYPERVTLAEAGVLSLAGDSVSSAQGLIDMLRETDWFAPAWIMLAAIAAAEQDAVPADLAPELERRIDELRPDIPRILFEHVELLIWLRLYSAEHPALEDLDLFGLGPMPR
jgi:tetratricopeptide (TPR) repeat protein